MILEVFPITSTRDLSRLAAFYAQAFDAHETYRFPDEGEPAYVALTVGGARLGIGSDPDATTDPDQRTAIWLQTDDCDATVERAVAAGAELLGSATDMPWGERVAHLRDPDGNPLHLGQTL